MRIILSKGNYNLFQSKSIVGGVAALVGRAFDLHAKNMGSIPGVMKKNYFRIFLGCTIISNERARYLIT